MSWCLSAAASNTGANARHGGHHVAQKSMNRMPPLFTVGSKLASVSSRVEAPICLKRITRTMLGRSPLDRELHFPRVRVLVGDDAPSVGEKAQARQPGSIGGDSGAGEVGADHAHRG